jgi:hypothetical protein
MNEFYPVLSQKREEERRYRQPGFLVIGSEDVKERILLLN